MTDFTDDYLFTALGIRAVYWYRGISDHTTPMGNLCLSTLDLAKIGQLMLSNG